MPVEYRIDVNNTAGSRVAVLTGGGPDGGAAREGYRSLAAQLQLNTPAVVDVIIGGDNPLLSLIGDKYQVEVWRRNVELGIPWYRFADTLFRDDVIEADDNGVETATLRCYGVLHCLAWRENLYPAETANRTLFSAAKAETIMKTLVQYNCTSSALASGGRDRDGAISAPTIAIQADAAGGNTLSWQSARGNVLKELQDLAQIGGGDFDLVRTGVTTFELRFYAGQRGTDRSATLTFGQEFGNMRRPKQARVRSTEATVAIVGGQGEKTTRVVRTRTSAAYNSTSNNVERFYNATQTADPTALDVAGDRALEQWKARTLLLVI